MDRTVETVKIVGTTTPQSAQILSPEALQFLAELHRRFNPRREELLQARQKRQLQLNQGIFPDFLPETADIRASRWQVAQCPKDLLNRRVEITGPVERKMMINALNSGAKVFMADFEDANSPTWSNVIAGQINCVDAVRGTLTFQNPDGKEYKLNRKNSHPGCAPAGMAFGREARSAGWTADFRQPVRLWHVFFPQCLRADRPRQRTLFLPTQNGKPSGSAAVERCLRVRSGSFENCPRHNSRHRSH